MGLPDRKRIMERIMLIQGKIKKPLSKDSYIEKPKQNA